MDEGINWQGRALTGSLDPPVGSNCYRLSRPFAHLRISLGNRALTAVHRLMKDKNLNDPFPLS